MKITLTPVRMDTPLILVREGDVLVFNGTETVDLSDYDAETSPCGWIIGQPEQGPDGWSVQILLPHGTDAPEETRFPAPIVLVADGPVALPPFVAPMPEEAGPGMDEPI